MRLRIVIRSIGLVVCALAGSLAYAADDSAISGLKANILELEQSLLAIENRLESSDGQDRLVVYLDIDRVPQLDVHSLSLTLEGRSIVEQALTQRQQAAIASGGMLKLYSAPLAPGKYELEAAFEGRIGDNYSYNKTFRFEKNPGLDVIKVLISDLLQQQRPQLVYRIEHWDRRP